MRTIFICKEIDDKEVVLFPVKSKKEGDSYINQWKEKGYYMRIKK